MGIGYGDRKVPPKVLRYIEEKARKATIVKNATSAAELKKRKAGGKSKTLAKKQKIAAASKAASADSEEEEVGEAGSISVGAGAEVHGMVEVAQTETSTIGGDEDLMAIDGY